MADATKALIDETVGFVDRPQSKPGKPWQVWLDAELGFRDYWYPAALAQQLGEGATRSITLLGEDIMLTRQNGPDVELTMCEDLPVSKRAPCNAPITRAVTFRADEDNDPVRKAGKTSPALRRGSAGDFTLRSKVAAWERR